MKLKLEEHNQLVSACRNKVDYSDYLKKRMAHSHALRLSEVMYKRGKLSSFLEVIPTYAKSGYLLNPYAEFLLRYLELSAGEEKIIFHRMKQIDAVRQRK